MMRNAAIGSVFAVLVGLTLPAYADGTWSKLSGPEIEKALDDRKLRYSAATQTFYKSGKTLYDAGRPSWGYWRVQGDEYCSQWPPNAGWECYGFERRTALNGEVELRFLSQTGHATNAEYTE
jgi:hypothetical protein